jgi:drug/metabolite transporter (DMT)-like permease
MIAGLALALGSALGTNVAFLFKQRGAVMAPPVQGRHPLRSAVGLFRSRWFSLGWAVAVAAWALHVGALALAPLSVVQAVLSGGLVFLAMLAERYFGFQLGRRQWTGVSVTAFGLAVIAVTGGSHTSALRHYSLAALIAVECGVFAIGAALIMISMHGSLDPATKGLLLGVAAGVLFGVSDIALKYLTQALHGGLQGIVSEWTLTALAASVLAFYASARGLQLGPGVTVIAFTSVAANLAAIMGGILVFRDPIGIGAPAIVGRVIAFGLVIAGTAFMPAPRRADREQRSPASRQA